MSLLESLIPKRQQSLMVAVGQAAEDAGITAFVVGGFVRDAILRRPTTDIDFVALGPGSGIRLAELVAERLKGAKVHVYKQFGTAAIRVSVEGERMVLEFVAARRESYSRESRKPVIEDGTLDDDLQRRDFTVNALAAPLTGAGSGELVDRYSGLRDLDRGILRTPVDPYQTFSDDPLRLVRAARFAAQLQFQIAEETQAAMKSEAHRIDIVSPERIVVELQKIIDCRRPSIGFRFLEENSVLARFLPELSALRGVDQVEGQRHKDNFYHTLEVVDNLVEIAADQSAAESHWLRWAALFHDIGKPSTKRFRAGTGWTFHGHEDRGSRMIPALFKRLRLPLDERADYVEKLIRLHHRPVALVDSQVTDSAVRRLLFDAGEDIDDLMTLVRADITSKNPKRVRRYLRGFDKVDEKLLDVEERDHLRSFQPPIDGQEIMEILGIGAGLTIGILKGIIREAILDGEIPNQRDPAIELLTSNKENALRRGELFAKLLRSLEGGEKRAVGAIKEAVLSADLPIGEAAAVEFLHGVKDRFLSSIG